jgi:hypothetical protein
VKVDLWECGSAFFCFGIRMGGRANGFVNKCKKCDGNVKKADLVVF